MEEPYKHPEWKRLFDAFMEEYSQDADVHGRIYEYPKLAQMAGIDIKSQKGRQQFEKFNEECKDVFQLHFENVRNVGYRIVLESERLACSTKRIKRGARQVRKARHIVTTVDMTKLDDAQKQATMIFTAGVNALVDAMRRNTKQLKKLAVAIEQPKLIDPSITEKTMDLFKPKEHTH